MSEPRTVSEHGRRHGRPSSWALVAVAALAFATGGAALILQAWLIVYICAALFALCVPVGALIGIMDDTVSWTTPPPQNPRWARLHTHYGAEDKEAHYRTPVGVDERHRPHS